MTADEPAIAAVDAVSDSDTHPDPDIIATAADIPLALMTLRLPLVLKPLAS